MLPHEAARSHFAIGPFLRNSYRFLLEIGDALRAVTDMFAFLN